MEAIELSSLDGFKAGDIAVLSDPMTQAEFEASVVMFDVSSVRTYANTKEDVKYTCYLLGFRDNEDGSDNEDESEEEDGDDTLMIVVTEKVGFYEIALYFLENSGYLNNTEGSASTGYDDLIDPIDGDFVDLMIVINKGGKNGNEIHWYKRDRSYLDLTLHTDTGVHDAALCEYATEDSNYGSDRSIVTCKDPSGAGAIEMWYGYRLQDHEVELYVEGTEL